MEIDGYDGNYLIFPNGFVFSKKRMIFLKEKVDRGGYKYTTLCKNSIRKHFRIHRLIGQYFIPNPNNYPVIDHIDRNRLNNNISNLRWTTIRENCRNKKQESSFTNCKGVYVNRDKYQSRINISNLFDTLQEAIIYRNILYKELNRRVINDMKGILKIKSNKYQVYFSINKNYNTLEEAIEGRKQLELKYWNN